MTIAAFPNHSRGKTINKRKNAFAFICGEVKFVPRIPAGLLLKARADRRVAEGCAVRGTRPSQTSSHSTGTEIQSRTAQTAGSSLLPQRSCCRLPQLRLASLCSSSAVATLGHREERNQLRHRSRWLTRRSQRGSCWCFRRRSLAGHSPCARGAGSRKASPAVGGL